MIPQMLLKRVDVVTGGASAVYGSDAISGVVNFITDKGFNGVKTNIQTGISDKGDGRQSQFGVAYGTALSDKAHFVGSYEFRDDKGILTRSSRPATALTTIQGAGTAGLPFFVAKDTGLATTSFGGLIRNGVLAGQHFETDGILSTFDTGTRTGFTPTVPTQSGGDGAYYDASLKAPLRSHQLFGRFDYNFTDMRNLNDEVRFRSTRSRDIRAPTLDDLFTSPTTTTGANATDSLLGVQSNAPNTARANPDLKAEKGDTTTIGVVYRPSRIRGFSLALDAFNIEVSDAITQVQGTNFTYQAACYASGGTSPLCVTQTRALGNFTNTPDNVVTQWFSMPINFAKVHTWGADFEANYATSVNSHPLTLRGLVTWQPHIKYEIPGSPTLDMGGVAAGANGLQASPEWRATAFVRYSPVKDLSIDLMQRWRSSLAISADPTQVTRGRIESFHTTNLNINYTIKHGAGSIDLYANVQNLGYCDPRKAGLWGTGARRRDIAVARWVAMSACPQRV